MDIQTHSHPEIIEMQVRMLELTKKVERHEALLVTGTDDQLSLPELVRALTTTVNNYIKRKESEEEQKKKEWNRWKWAVLGVAIPSFLLLFGQAVWFYVRFIPVAMAIMEQQ